MLGLEKEENKALEILQTNYVLHTTSTLVRSMSRQEQVAYAHVLPVKSYFSLRIPPIDGQKYLTHAGFGASTVCHG